MDENKRLFMASAILVAMEEQWEMFAQGIASYFKMAGSDPTDVFNEMGAFYGRITDIMSDGVSTPIWPELEAGGNQTNDLLPLLEQLATYGPFKSTATEGMRSVELLIEAVDSGQLRDTIIEGRIKKYLEGHDVSDLVEFSGVTTAPDDVKHVAQVIDHIAHLNEDQVATIREHLKAWKIAAKENIKLDFPVAVYLDEGEVYFANGIEFFTDENDWSWMKFFPKNGANPKMEHIFSHSRLNHIVRMDKRDDE